MIENNPYTHFKNYVLRTPALPINFYNTLMAGNTVEFCDFRNYFREPLIAESIFLASPSFYERLHNIYEGENKISKKKNENLNLSFLKYLVRMSTRCTPFGLFAGCSLGSFNDFNEITNDDPYANSRFTRLDMNYLYSLAQDLEKLNNVIHNIDFFPNSSIYNLNDHIRYIEYSNENNIRHHEMISIDRNEILDEILEMAKGGTKFKCLIDLLISKGYSEQISESYLKELIESKMLISNMEPSVTGGDFLEHIVETLKIVDKNNYVIPILLQVKESLNKIDKKIGNHPTEYKVLSDLINEVGTSFDQSLLYQSELIIKPTNNFINKSLITDISKGIDLFNKISPKNKSKALKQFKEDFRERYEGKEINLANALDVDVGIGYASHRDIRSSPLVDQIVLPEITDNDNSSNISLSKVNQIIHKKIIDALINKEKKINLEEDDFKNLENYWDDLPDTISCMVSVIPGEEKIKFNGFYGSSGANLLTRFCHGNKEISDQVRKIIDKEEELSEDKLLAEIVHLPKSRMGNILNRPHLREYEISYLGKSDLADDKQINVSDLTIRYSNNRLILKSKRLNKEIIPRLTSAHNFSSDQLPVYHFLCDMQNDEKRNGLGLDLAPLMSIFKFIPRIEFGNLILNEATWNLTKSQCEDLFNIENSVELLKKIEVFTYNLDLPTNVKLIEGDNELPISFDNITSIRMLLKTIKNKERFILKEFLFNSNNPQEGNHKISYVNELIVSFYKNIK